MEKLTNTMIQAINTKGFVLWEELYSFNSIVIQAVASELNLEYSFVEGKAAWVMVKDI